MTFYPVRAHPGRLPLFHVNNFLEKSWVSLDQLPRAKNVSSLSHDLGLMLRSRGHLSNSKRFPCLRSMILTQGRLEEFETVMQTRDEVDSLRNSQISQLTNQNLHFENLVVRLYSSVQSFLSHRMNFHKMSRSSSHLSIFTIAHYWERNFIIFKGEAVLNLPCSKKIIWVIGVLRRTVVCNWRFDNLCRSHLDHAYYRWPRPRYRPIHRPIYRSTIGRLLTNYRWKHRLLSIMPNRPVSDN